MIELRMRSRIPAVELQNKIGKVLGPRDYNVLVTGPVKVFKPDGTLLCVYVQGALAAAPEWDDAYPALHSLRSYVSDNRGDASGTLRVRREGDGRTRTKRVQSAMVGSFDPVGPKKYCRHSSWSIRHPDAWNSIVPLLVRMGDVFGEHVPDRYAHQMRMVERSYPEWIIDRTPYTTITVNNSYPTGVHTDKGDLDQGFSTIAVFSRGNYSGCRLVFPSYRLAFDLRHGDVLLMDAHEHHGNTDFVPLEDGAERISIVAYYRTEIAGCGSPEDELAKAAAYHDAGGTLR